MYIHNVFIYSNADKHLVCFQILNITSNSALNSLVINLGTHVHKFL